MFVTYECPVCSFDSDQLSSNACVMCIESFLFSESVMSVKSFYKGLGSNMGTVAELA